MTPRESDLLVYLARFMAQNGGVCPSLVQMAGALDLRSKSGIHRLLTGLEERGHIRRLKHRARAIEILRLPDNGNACPCCARLYAC